jgi:hypothetical protein
MIIFAVITISLFVWGLWIFAQREYTQKLPVVMKSFGLTDEQQKFREYDRAMMSGDFYPWSPMPADPTRWVIYYCVPIDDGEAPYMFKFEFAMPIEEVVNTTREVRKGVLIPNNQNKLPEWWKLPAYEYIKAELDKKGYDFIPSHFVAVRRTERWKVND